MANVNHFGCVIEDASKAPVADAVVRLVSEDGKAPPPPTLTDNTGCFKFENLSEDDKWQIVVYQLDGEATDPERLDLTKGTEQSLRALYPVVVTSKVVNQKLGTAFLLLCLALLAILIGIWISHSDDARIARASDLLEASAEIDLALVSIDAPDWKGRVETGLETVEDRLTAMSAPPALAAITSPLRHEIGAGRLLLLDDEERASAAAMQLKALDADGLPDGWAEAIDSAVAAVADGTEDALDAIAAPEVDAATGRRISALRAVLATALGAAPAAEGNTPERDALSTILQRLDAEIPAIAKHEFAAANQTGLAFDWTIGSSELTTVLFWSFVGALTGVIMRIQGYLRFGRFHERGIYQHIALLFIMPVTVAGFVKLASLVTISAGSSAGQPQLQIDFSDPQLMAVAAFLLALSPWRLWERLLGLSRGIAGSRADASGSGGSGGN